MRRAAESSYRDLETHHSIRCGDATILPGIPDASVQLVVTSPPYPMIAMWDEVFAAQSPPIRSSLDDERCDEAFEQMHQLLDRVWSRCRDVLIEGGFLCINIGDAVRTCGGEFRLFSNYARIVRHLTSLGFTLLPSVVWRKPTNSPTKFMGSGMLPGGAYVTLEHESIIICRKGTRRAAPATERERRRRSAVFWEERNEWYSDLWAFTGTRQELGGTAPSGAAGAATAAAGKDVRRKRSAAFPLELPFRLICMYSWLGDTVLDPFCGTGTTTCAAIAAGRSSIGIDSDPNLVEQSMARLGEPRTLAALQARSSQRLADHDSFIGSRTGETKHRHTVSGFPVVTGQETDIVIPIPVEVARDGNGAICRYHPVVPGRE